MKNIKDIQRSDKEKQQKNTSSKGYNVADDLGRTLFKDTP